MNSWISVVADVATALGLFAAAAGLFFNYSALNSTKKAVEISAEQLKATKQTIEASRLALEANTIYNIQRDANEFLRSYLFKDIELVDYISAYDPNKTYSAKLINKATLAIAATVQFYSTVYNQRRAGVISDTFWPSFRDEFCRFLKFTPVSKYWKTKVAPVNTGYNEEFKTLGNNCLNIGQQQ